MSLLMTLLYNFKRKNTKWDILSLVLCTVSQKMAAKRLSFLLKLGPAHHFLATWEQMICAIFLILISLSNYVQRSVNWQFIIRPQAGRIHPHAAVVGAASSPGKNSCAPWRAPGRRGRRVREVHREGGASNLTPQNQRGCIPECKKCWWSSNDPPPPLT